MTPFTIVELPVRLDKELAGDIPNSSTAFSSSGPYRNLMRDTKHVVKGQSLKHSKVKHAPQVPMNKLSAEASR